MASFVCLSLSHVIVLVGQQRAYIEIVTYLDTV